MQGDDVHAAQERLIALGYTLVGQADGFFGPKTASAVGVFQAINSLETDGIVGPQTWAQLFNPAARGPSADGLSLVIAANAEYVLGGALNGRWIDAAGATFLSGRPGPLRLYLPDGGVGEVNGDAPETRDAPCPDTIFIPLDPPVGDQLAVALSESAQPFPRPVKRGDLNDAQLKRGVAALLAQHNVGSSAARLTQALIADIDGDGSQEAVVSASVIQATDIAPDAAAGDYSLLAVFRDGTLVQELIGQYHPQASEFTAPEEFRLAALLDLNGDGSLEIVADSRYYEGQAMSAYSLQGDTFVEVLLTGCGA